MGDRLRRAGGLAAWMGTGGLSLFNVREMQAWLAFKATCSDGPAGVDGEVQLVLSEHYRRYSAPQWPIAVFAISLVSHAAR